MPDRVVKLAMQSRTIKVAITTNGQVTEKSRRSKSFEAADGCIDSMVRPLWGIEIAVNSLKAQAGLTIGC
jgi:hypothetical protein